MKRKENTSRTLGKRGAYTSWSDLLCLVPDESLLWCTAILKTGCESLSSSTVAFCSLGKNGALHDMAIRGRLAHICNPKWLIMLQNLSLPHCGSELLTRFYIMQRSVDSVLHHAEKRPPFWRTPENMTPCETSSKSTWSDNCRLMPLFIHDNFLAICLSSVWLDVFPRFKLMDRHTHCLS